MSGDAKSRLIYQFPEVFALEASAGSGKTYALAKRYTQLALLLLDNPNKEPIKILLALTFTNKTAFEMKLRILQFLKLIAFQQLKEKEFEDIIQPLNMTADKASKRAYCIMDMVVGHYNFFQVQTIDKFINALLSGCAFKIGLTANFQIKTNVRDYLQYSLDELIEDAKSNLSIKKMFDEFLHNYLYLENRSGWFPKQDMLSILSSLFNQNSSYGLAYEAGIYNSEDLVKKKMKLYADIKDFKGFLPQEANKGFLKSIDKFLKNGSKGFDVDSLSDYFAREDIPLNKGANEPGGLKKKWAGIKRDIRGLCEQEAYSVFNPYITAFKEMLIKFNALAKRDDCLFLSELNKKASLLFDEQYVTVEELYYRLATRYKHYLIDEFQDTSRLQWHNLEKMVEEALSTGGSLFYVGDKKQAIYGFRGGDATLFEDIKKRFEAFNVTQVALDKNWRSKGVIVEVNNRIFSIENLQRFLNEKREYENAKSGKNSVEFDQRDMERLSGIFGNSYQSSQDNGQLGFVSFEHIDVEKKEKRNEEVRNKLLILIPELKERFEYKDIALLARSNGEIELLTNWLLEEKIPVDSERTSDVKENTFIQELMYFLKFLNSPIDNYSFARFILGEVFTVATRLGKSELEGFLFRLRNDLKANKEFYLYRSFREAYPEVWEKFIEEFFRNAGLYPVYELVISIYNQFRCLENFKENQGFFMHLLELIKKNEDQHFDLTAFIDYFENLAGEDLYVYITDYNAVKILTIHKSKGLEYPVVVIPFLGIEVQVGTGTDNKQSYVMQKSQTHIELLKLKSKYQIFSEDLMAIYEKEYKDALFNELNNVYVALTRPVCELYCFIPKRVGNSYNFVRLLIPEECYKCGEKFEYPDLKRRTKKTKPIPLGQYQDWFKYLRDEFEGSTQVRNRHARIDGDVLHCILSHIGNVNAANVEGIIRNAINAAKAKYLSIDDFSAYENQIKTLLEQENVRPYFYLTQAEVYTEKDIVTSEGLTKRIDRMIIKEGAVVIIDFKSKDEYFEEYYAQIKVYKDALREIYPRMDISGQLIYMDSGRVEKVE